VCTYLEYQDFLFLFLRYLYNSKSTLFFNFTL
jgi:hypothetical protein